MLFAVVVCLLECMHAHRIKTPILIIEVANSGFDVREVRHYINNIEAVMGNDNPDGLSLLYEHLDFDLNELKSNILEILASFQEDQNKLVWNPNASDLELLASLKDIIEKMAQSTEVTLK